MNKRLICLATVAALAAGPVVAAEYDFVVTNKTDADLQSINVRNGQVNGFKKVVQGGERSFTISLPDGVCETRLQFNFNDADSIVMDKYDACNSGGIDVTY